MACISAETGTLVFAIINLALVTGSSLLGIGLLIFCGLSIFYDYPRSSPDVSVLATVLLASFGLLFSSLISLIFSSFLMNGILKKKPEHIKVYYIFGIVKMVLGLSFLLSTFSFDFNADVFLYIYIYAFVLVIYAIYSMILYMIRYTYVQYETEHKQYGHKRLDEKC